MSGKRVEARKRRAEERLARQSPPASPPGASVGEMTAEVLGTSVGESPTSVDRKRLPVSK